MNEATARGLRRRAFMQAALATAATGAMWPHRAWAAEPAGPSVPPDEALERLMKGNENFVAGTFQPTSRIAEKREILAHGQAPFAAILACADSRVVPNAIFVQGLGDLFVARVAGNFPDDMVTGSLEYAIEHLGTRLIMVLGHESCGAVKAVYDATESNSKLPKHLLTLQQYMGPGIAPVVKAKGTEDQAVQANVRAAVAALTDSQPVLAGELAKKRIRVVGAEYHLAKGAVTLLD